MTAVLAIGDSHCRFWAPLAPEVLTYHVGPALAWSLASEGSRTLGRAKVLAAIRWLAPQTWALLCFGEIDIRCHVLANGKAGPSECADRYLDFVREAMALHERIAIWAPTATQPTSMPDDELYPSVGTEIERNRATLAFTERLRGRASAPVISILDCMVDRGLTKPETLADGRHASQSLRPIAAQRLRAALGIDIGAPT